MPLVTISLNSEGFKPLTSFMASRIFTPLSYLDISGRHFKRVLSKCQDNSKSMWHRIISWLSTDSNYLRLQSHYETEFSKFKPDKKLMWMSHLGTIKLEIEMDDGTVVNADVPPLEAAFIELFAGKGSLPVVSISIFLSVVFQMNGPYRNSSARSET